MGTAKRVVVVNSAGRRSRLAEPVALTTPILTDDGTEPVWIEGAGMIATPLEVQEDGVTAEAATDTIDFARALLAVSIGGGAVQVELDESEIDSDAIPYDNTISGLTATAIKSAIDEVAAASGGAPTTVDYLVGTASGGLSAEIVVGTTPGGELGGTWASPTVDATHSGSTHSGAAAAAVATHEGAGDPHTGYRLESADHTHATTGLQGGTVDHGALTGLADDDHPQYATNTEFDDHNARHEPGGADPMAVDAAQATGSLRTITTSAPQAIGTAAAGSGTAAASSNHVHATGAGTPSTQAMGDGAATGSGPAAAMTDHKHAMPALGFGLTNNATPAVSLTTAQTFITATTSISAATYADITGATVSLAAGTWLILATIVGSCVTTTAGILVGAITHSDNTVLAEASQSLGIGTATVAQNGCVNLSVIVSPGSTTTYKLRAARGTTTYTSTITIMDGASLNTANNVTDNSDKGTSIRALRIA